MPNATTPATTHDATQVRPVRIPEQFPDTHTISSALSSALKHEYIDQSQVSEIVISADTNFFDCTADFSAGKYFTLSETNFHPVTGLFVFQCRTSAATTEGAALRFNVSGTGFTKITVEANSVTTIVMALYAVPDQPNNVVVLSSSSVQDLSTSG